MVSRRILGVVFALLIVAAPVAHVVLGTQRTIALPVWPPVELAHVRSGLAMRFFERWFDEGTPAGVWLRQAYHRLWWELGMFEVPAVRFGRDGWWFLGQTLDADAGVVARLAPRRMRFYRQLRRRCDALGVRLLVVVVPDKARVYADRLVEPASPARRGLYGTILGELGAAGIEAVDLASVFERARAERPGEPLYYARDSHWTIAGMRAAADGIVARIDGLGWSPLLDAPAGYGGLVEAPDDRVPDLVMMLGFPAGGDVERAMRHGKQRPELGLEPVVPDASIAVCGDSFAFEGLYVTLAAATGQRVDSAGSVPAVGPFPGLLDVLTRIESGALDARVVVWEFVERSYLEPAWLAPPDPR